jgi:hypothetical protein
MTGSEFFWKLREMIGRVFDIFLSIYSPNSFSEREAPFEGSVAEEDGNLPHIWRGDFRSE